MTTEPARAGFEWLTLREPADAAARSAELVEEVRRTLPDRVDVHDLGCGTGSMARWLAPQLDGPQHWTMYDRDAELLDLVAAHPPPTSADGAAVTLRTRAADITRLGDRPLAGAALVTASALLDMLTRPELDRLVTACLSPGCAVLVTLTVTGRVDLEPSEPLDRRVGSAFNGHQRRDRGAGALLGPDAAGAAADAFGGAGREVTVRPSPWRLGPEQRRLTAAWFDGWWTAACEQDPELARAAASYPDRRLAQAREGRLAVTVHHQDLLVSAAAGRTRR
jgi:SAM-dependent methyltransferase